MKSLSTTAKLAWAALAINLVTVLGGTLVRATGSGAGCGASWPSCHGALLPGMASLHTKIEFAHRAFSGMALVSVLGLFVMVYRNHEKQSSARRAVHVTALAIIIESLLGAWLVLARLVEDDASVMRTISVPIHLVNTLFLLAALSATAWTLSTNKPLHWPRVQRRKFLLGAIGLLLLGATGAITALADTLFPVDELQLATVAGVEETAHFLTRLRIIHPLVAVLVSAFLFYVAGSVHERTPGLSRLIMALIGIQLALGVANVLLFTPVSVQILHLLVADLIWIALVLVGVELGSASSTPASSS